MRDWRAILAQAQGYRPGDGRQLLIVDTASQSLLAFEDATLCHEYAISSSRYGLGCADGSHQTPTGWHRIAEKIGAHAPAGEIFRGRVAQGCKVEDLDPDQRRQQDLITSRILWLAGLQPGWNQGDGCDSYNRYIYIHGTAAVEALGTPASIGCVRMFDRDVIELFDWVDTGTPVYISGDA